ncbi:MAG: cell division protein ZapB [candidate division WOR-3 bacterium]
MAKSQAQVTGLGEPGASTPKPGSETVSSGPAAVGPGVVECFAELERRIEAAIGLVTRLREENRELARRLAEAEQSRKQAAERIDSVLDKLEAMT